jgi:hypothetical protein
MRKLTNNQTRLLEAAASRKDGSVLPIPEDLAFKGGALTSSLKALENRGVIEKARTGKSITWTITTSGYEAIGRELPACRIATGSAKRSTKADAIAALLRRPDGAPMPHIMRATNWQAHSVRAAISGLRKRGLAVSRTVTDDGISTYHIADAQ